jgi:hypothetical protein
MVSQLAVEDDPPSLTIVYRTSFKREIQSTAGRDNITILQLK